MVLSANTSFASAAQAVPRFIPDLRPSADAAASTRDDRPVATLAIASAGPPSPTQAAKVSRSMTTLVKEAERSGGDVVSQLEKAQRTLKPYGVAMLPRTEMAEESEKRANNMDRPAKTVDKDGQTKADAQTVATHDANRIDPAVPSQAGKTASDIPAQPEGALRSDSQTDPERAVAPQHEVLV